MNTSKNTRLASIDIMRGLTIFLMLFVNDLYVPGVPHWLVHAATREDSIGLADLVLPAFLFMVGLSVPFAITARRKKEFKNKSSDLLFHILIRSASLILIGVLILNGSERINSELTGMPKLIWLLLLYLGVFLVWNQYRFVDKIGHQSGVEIGLGLKILGGLLLLFLLWKFKAGNEMEPSWLRHGWWGILGLIGWGYLAAALTFLFMGKNLFGPLVIWSVFLFFNIASVSGWTDGVFNGWLGDVLGVWFSGNVPLITLSGLLIGMLIYKGNMKMPKLLCLVLLLGLLAIIAGFGLRHWFIFSKNIGTPSWAMVCVGLSCCLLAFLYYIVDLKGICKWAYPFTLAGRNALTTYLAPDMIYFVVWYFGWPLFFYKQTDSAWIAITGSLAWSIIMIFYVHLLSKFHVLLKL